MRVILATESFAPNISGVATATKNLADNLTAAGHEAIVVTPGKVRKTTLDKNFAAYPVYRVTSVPNPFRQNYRLTRITKAEAIKLLKKVNPDIIHLQDPAAIGKAFRDAGRELKIPVVITNHFSLEYALSYVRFLNPLLPLVKDGLIKYLARFYNKCDQVVTPTETFRKQLVSWGVKAPVHAVSNGIRLERFLEDQTKSDLYATRIKYHIPDNPIVLYLGRVDKDKSIDVLVRAIPHVLKETNAHFVIAGNGGQIPEIQKLAQQLNVSNDLTIIGFLDHNSPDFVRMYKSASLFAIPSTIETQSLVTLEAMSSGLPIVACDAGALPELVHNDKNGYLFKAGDYKTLAKDIIKILENKAMEKKFGEESIKIAMNHAMPKAFAEMVSLYELTIDRKKSSTLKATD